MTEALEPRSVASWRVAAIKNGLRDAIIYPWEFLFEILGSMIMPALIQLLLWSAVFSGESTSRFGTMTLNDLLHYTVVSLLFSQVRGGNLDFELQEMIRTGSLSHYLLRPINLHEFIYLRGSAPRFLLSGICLLLGFIILPILGYSPWGLVPAMLLALLGNIIHYQLGIILTTAAFYWEEGYSILMVKNMVTSFLSGELLPLTLFSGLFEWTWKLTPFYLYVFGPTQIALGKWGYEECMQAFFIGFMWILGLGLLTRASWNLGMKKYLSLGG